jgi:hypothetical protein
MAYLAGTTPQWIKITKSYTDFATAGLTNDIEIFSLPARSMIHATQIYAPTKFSGGLISAFTISVGITGTLTKYAAAVSVFTAATLQQPSAITGIESISAATSIRAQAISVTGNLNAATQGAVEIYLLVSKLP